MFLLVIAATLLVSYRTGLELAAWCALLLLLAHAASDAGIIGTEPIVSDRFALVSASTFLVFALARGGLLVGQRTVAAAQSRATRMAGRADHRARALAPRRRRHGDARPARVRPARLHPRGRAREARRRLVGSARRRRRRVARRDGGSDTPPALEWLSSSSPLLVRTLEDGLLDAVLPDARNVVVAPVVADDERFGIVAAEWGGRDDAQIPVLTVRALAQAGMHTASALHTAALLDEVERLATRDSLTGIANRRLFDESLGREAARRATLEHVAQPHRVRRRPLQADQRRRTATSSGDAVLRSVADSIVASTKSFDLAARYGGDEFVLLLPDCDHDQAMRVAERVRAEIGRQVLEVPVTVSAGLATMPGQRHRRRPAALRGRRRALRGEAQRARPRRRVDPRGGCACRRWCVSTRRSSPAAPDAGDAGVSPGRPRQPHARSAGLAQVRLRSIPGRCPPREGPGDREEHA